MNTQKLIFPLLFIFVSTGNIFAATTESRRLGKKFPSLDIQNTVCSICKGCDSFSGNQLVTILCPEQHIFHQECLADALEKNGNKCAHCNAQQPVHPFFYYVYSPMDEALRFQANAAEIEKLVSDPAVGPHHALAQVLTDERFLEQRTGFLDPHHVQQCIKAGVNPNISLVMPGAPETEEHSVHKVPMLTLVIKGFRGHQEFIGPILRVLINAGAIVDQIDCCNLMTALHWAAYRGILSAVEELLAADADPTIVDNEGLTAFGCINRQSPDAEKIRQVFEATARRRRIPAGRIINGFVATTIPKEMQPLATGTAALTTEQQATSFATLNGGYNPS